MASATTEFPFDEATQTKFWAKSKRQGKCRVWTSTLNKGRPQFSVRGQGKRPTFQGPSYALLISGVDVPKGALVIQSCGNALCVEPSHLRVGTQADLMRWSREVREAQFWAHVARIDDGTSCWEWQGRRNAFGYGSAYWANKPLNAHRLAFMLANDEFDLAEVDFICHHCDNPPCCRPNHLYKGDAKANAQDRSRRRRANNLPSFLCGPAKLNPDQVREIRERHAAGESYPALAAAFGVHHMTIGNACRRKTYDDIP